MRNRSTSCSGHELAAGTIGTVAGRYQVVGLLGAGGMADVLLADDRVLDRRVALKCNRAEGGPRGRLALHREARITARLDHPAVVRLHDRVVDRGACYLVLEHLAGPTLAAARVLHHRAPALTRIARDLAGALAHLHARGVVHLDLKPENVVVIAGTGAKLIDFGIAWCAGETDLTDDPETLLGTPRAMAPEHIYGAPVDGRADLFALGTLLYELAAGRSPFAADTALETLERVLSHEPEPIAALAPSLPPSFAELIGHLLEKDPALRPQSAGEVLARLPAHGA